MRRKPIRKEPTLFYGMDCYERAISRERTFQRLKEEIPWEEFRGILSTVRRPSPKGGRPPYDEIFMFKCLVLQSLYDLSDESLEAMIADRLSFQYFLGMNLDSDVPDHGTFWQFRELLKKNNLIEPLFRKFHDVLESRGIILRNGVIADATIINAPKQRNTKRQNEALKEGQDKEMAFPEASESTLRHKDGDARWTLKRNVSYFGYKDHILADADSKFIVNFIVTSANVHDGTQLLSLLPQYTEEPQPVYADSAYGGSANLQGVRERGFIPEICEKGYRNRSLTEEQRQRNMQKSKIRCRIEHVFGDMNVRLKRLCVRTIGFERAKVKIGLLNLTYNIRRFLTLTSQTRKFVIM